MQKCKNAKMQKNAKKCKKMQKNAKINLKKNNSKKNKIKKNKIKKNNSKKNNLKKTCVLFLFVSDRGNVGSIGLSLFETGQWSFAPCHA